MPLEKCIKHGNKRYCWDSEKEEIVEVVLQPISINDCPEIVVHGIMRLMSRENKEGQYGN